jgi:hypothetical protein
MAALCLLCVFSGADPPKLETLRYVRPEGAKFVLESEITIRRDKDGHRYVSRTVRPGETMTLTVRRTLAGRLVKVEVVQQKGSVRKVAAVEPHEGGLRLTRAGATEDIKLKDASVFTTAPDWSDVIVLASRYDLKKGGKQEFVGLWIHPTRPTLTPKYSAEKVGEDKITAGGVDYSLRRFKMRLRASTVTVWVFPNGRVCKILPEGEKAVPVVLEGYEAATRDLK